LKKNEPLCNDDWALFSKSGDPIEEEKENSERQKEPVEPAGTTPSSERKPLTPMQCNPASERRNRNAEASPRKPRGAA